jgi:hypothetical protein
MILLTTEQGPEMQDHRPLQVICRTYSKYDIYCLLSVVYHNVEMKVDGSTHRPTGIFCGNRSGGAAFM